MKKLVKKKIKNFKPNFNSQYKSKPLEIVFRLNQFNFKYLAFILKSFLNLNSIWTKIVDNNLLPLTLLFYLHLLKKAFKAEIDQEDQ